MNGIIFDLDDTLHRERRWALSGFAAVASYLEDRRAVDRSEMFRLLVGAMRTGHRHEALQQLCEQTGLPADLIPELVSVIRTHRPRLRLDQTTVDVLARLRQTWRLGVLTNGRPVVQERKVMALGLETMVDAIVYADHYGGKPRPRAFLTVVDRLSVSPQRCVFVGDDPWCDISGARRVGMRTIRIERGRRISSAHAPPEADAVISSIGETEGAVARIMWGEPDNVIDDLRACG